MWQVVLDKLSITQWNQFKVVGGKMRSVVQQWQNILVCILLLLHQGSCPSCPCLFSPMSATPPCSAPPRLTSPTSGKPGSVSEAPGSTPSSGRCPPSWVGAAMALRDPGPHAPSSGTSARPPASHMCCVSSSSACCSPFYSWSTLMDESCLQSGGWVDTNLLPRTQHVIHKSGLNLADMRLTANLLDYQI